MYSFFFSSRRRHTRCALVTGVQTCALPISIARASATRIRRRIIISLLPCGGGAGSVAGIAIALSHQARIIGGQVRGSQRRQVRLSHLRALAQNFFSEIAQLLDPLGQDASLDRKSTRLNSSH